MCYSVAQDLQPGRAQYSLAAHGLIRTDRPFPFGFVDVEDVVYVEEGYPIVVPLVCLHGLVLDSAPLAAVQLLVQPATEEMLIDQLP